jgi:predicted porin
LDFGVGAVSGTQVGVKGTTVGTSGGVVSSTSVINIIAVEDLGGGMKATAKYGIDPRAVANDGAALTNSADATPTKNTMTAFSKDELFVGLQGGFGNIRLGSPNSIGLGVHLDSSPLGTGIGAGYTGGGVAGSMTMTYSAIRYNRSVRYDSPSMNGFTVSALYAPGNDQTQVTATTALGIPNAREVTELGLSYANGPLKISFANIAQAAQTNGTGWYAATAVTAPANAKTSMNMIAANYKVGATTVFALVNNGDTSVNTKAEGYRVGLRQDIGAMALMASHTSLKTAGVEATVTGLRGDYNLSKTAAAYIGLEKHDTGAATANKRDVVAVGMRKSF